MKKLLSIVSVMLLFTANTAMAQFPGGWGAPQPQKAISQDPNVKAPHAEVSNYQNKLRQVSSSLTYDFNKESCKLKIVCIDLKENKELTLSMNYTDDFAQFNKWLNKLAKEAKAMLDKATSENSRQRINLPKVSLNGSIKDLKDENSKGHNGGISADGHFVIQNEIATWEIKFSPARGGMGFGGGFPGGGFVPQGAPAQNQISYTWVFRNLDEFTKLLEVADKATLNIINKELIKQGKEMEANYNK